ncbi:MarR family winged helix-turn-helix transcriptional regulator [Chitinophaga sp. 30R24]|uniref:MarR family winged helix-turn-helix transcriptional regulator n=1 Tax=Chitinophaga sp. 30R24 TaxID=3248838 RepID=UPI003B90816C
MTTTIQNTVSLARDLTRAMNETRNYLRQYLQVKIKEHEVDITFELLEILGYLYWKDGANQQEIADRLIKDKSSMTYLIDGLEKREMVERIEDPNDRRSKLIYLTEKAKGLEEMLSPWITEIYEKATEGVKASDIKKALQLVQKMNENLRK